MGILLLLQMVQSFNPMQYQTQLLEQVPLLAISYDLSNLWLTANIEETNIDDVEIGQNVDVYVDAFPNTSLKRKVEEIGLATAGTFSLLPTNTASGNYTKEVQVIPVRISIESILT